MVLQGLRAQVLPDELQGQHVGPLCAAAYSATPHTARAPPLTAPACPGQTCTRQCGDVGTRPRGGMVTRAMRTSRTGTTSCSTRGGQTRCSSPRAPGASRSRTQPTASARRAVATACRLPRQGCRMSFTTRRGLWSARRGCTGSRSGPWREWRTTRLASRRGWTAKSTPSSCGGAEAGIRGSMC